MKLNISNMDEKNKQTNWKQKVSDVFFFCWFNQIFLFPDLNANLNAEQQNTKYKNESWLQGYIRPIEKTNMDLTQKKNESGKKRKLKWDC